MATPKLLIDPTVAEIYDLDAQIAVLQARKQKLAAALIEQGEGTYLENDLPDARKVVVVVPSKWSTKYDLYAPAALKAFLETRGAKKQTPELVREFRALRESAAAALAGEQFKKLFDVTTVRTPTKGFEDLVPKLLATAKGELSAKGRDLLIMCQIATPPKEAHIKLPDKPKTVAEEEEEA